MNMKATFKGNKSIDLSGHVLTNVNCPLPYSQGLETKKNARMTAYEIKPLQSTELHNGA